MIKITGKMHKHEFGIVWYTTERLAMQCLCGEARLPSLSEYEEMLKICKRVKRGYLEEANRIEAPFSHQTKFRKAAKEKDEQILWLKKQIAAVSIAAIIKG